MTPTASARLARIRCSPLNGLATSVLLALVVAMGAGLGCAKNEKNETTPAPPLGQPDAASSDTGTTPAPGKDGATTTADVGNGVDAQAQPTTCASLRNCITRCAADAACQKKCSDTATAPAKAAYATVTTCSTSGCDFNDELCRCQRECMGDGACVNEVDECRSFDNDLFCEVNCGS
jgi:hypothetical protein